MKKRFWAISLCLIMVLTMLPLTASAVAPATYAATIEPPAETVPMPTFGLAEGTYASAQSVTILCDMNDAAIYYTTDGADPTESSLRYSGPISVTETTTIKAKAIIIDFGISETASATYIINIAPPPAAPVATPTFGTAGGTYTSAQIVTLFCETPDATIRYTTNGADPTATGNIYGRSIYINCTTTIKAVAFKDGMTASPVASATYIINIAPPPAAPVATPTFGTAGGTYTSVQSVTLSCATPGATIRYTTNGTTPIENSPVYNSAIPISASTIVKAVAFKDGMTASAIAEVTYIICLPVDELGISAPPAPDYDYAVGVVSSVPSAIEYESQPIGGDYTPSPVTIYNEPSAHEATVWITGSGLGSGDLLITERDPDGSAYQALAKLADISAVFATYDIHLKSGKKSASSAMHLTFDLDAEYAGQDFTLVHQKADSTYEYFYDAAANSGELTFGPLYELSPFMLVKGTLEPTPASPVDNSETDIPQLLPWLGAALLVGAGVTAFLVIRQRKRKNG